MVIEKQENEKIKGGKGKIVIIAGIVIIILLLAATIFLLLQNKEDSAPRRNVVVNQANVEKAISDMEEEVPVRGGSYEVTMNSTWKFADGKSASENAYVENVTSNTNDVYFDINRSDTEELLYSSPILPLGSYLDNITLDTELSAGTYDCVLTYHLVDENQKTVSTLKLSLTIVVEH